jgi:dTDP-4-amino-4,6-dideoxygalactose transaminase
MVVTSEETVAQTVRSLRNYGASRKYYHTDPAGTNSRLDTLQAAVLNVKLSHLPAWNQARNALAQAYDRKLAPLAEYGIVPIRNEAGPGHVYHLYVVRVTADCPRRREDLQARLGERQIQTGIHYPIPCHLQPAFTNLGYGPGAFPQAEALSQEILSLPMYPGLTEAQIDQVVDAMLETVTSAPPTAVTSALG